MQFWNQNAFVPFDIIAKLFDIIATSFDLPPLLPPLKPVSLQADNLKYFSQA